MNRADYLIRALCWTGLQRLPGRGRASGLGLSNLTRPNHTTSKRPEKKMSIKSKTGPTEPRFRFGAQGISEIAGGLRGCGHKRRC